MTLAPFTREAIDLLKQLGYRYLVVDKTSVTAYARRESTPKENLDLLSLQEYDLEEVNYKILNLEIAKIEIPPD